MKKILLLLTCSIIFATLCSCQTVPDPSELTVVRYPTLNASENDDFSAYDQAKLILPEYSDIVVKERGASVQTVSIGDQSYHLNYTKTCVWKGNSTEQSDLSNDLTAYDVYTNDSVQLEVFARSNAVKKMSITREGLKDEPLILTDFTESGMKACALRVLEDVYGSEIHQYLNSYYQFEYAKLMTYSNSELNRYVVSYRAYIDSIPTDDVLYVHFTTAGQFRSVSAKNYLQYLSYDTSSLISSEILNEAIENYVTTLGYNRIVKREQFPAAYFTLNADGIIYYVTEWEAFIEFSEGMGTTIVETIAVKAVQ